MHDMSKLTRRTGVELDPSAPLHSARILLGAQFTTPGGISTLYRHRGAFWHWIGSRYRQTDDETVRAQIWAFLEKALRREKDSTVPFKPTRAKVGDVLDALGAVTQLDKYTEAPEWIGDASADMPPAHEFLACANGLLHLPSGELYPPTAAYFNVISSKAVFDADAPAPVQWVQFLDQIFGDDVEAKMLLQDWFGYLLAPDTSQHKILLAVGPPRCGKGTIARVLTEVLGRDSVGGPTMSGLAGDFGLEPLICKSLAIISDARIGARTNKSAVLERLLSISGEDSQTVNRKHVVAWDGKLPTRFMILTNALLSLSDESGALANRFVILTMKNSFLGKEDPLLTSKLLSELPGILNWSIEGYRRLRERGHFVQPKSSSEAAEQIEMLGSPIKAFVRDKCRVGPGLEVSHDELWAAYKFWCEEQGTRDAGNKAWFGRNLMSAEPGLKTVRRGAIKQAFYHGIGLVVPF
jgi:putative DNA primase/helicase